MSDFAGVDPHRVRQLADRLKDLADTLDKEGATIRKLFSGWDGAVNQSLLAQQAAQVRSDARDMSRRADEALNLQHLPRFVDPNDPHRNWTSIPWDVTKIDTVREAQQEEGLLKQALDHPDDPQSRATIDEVAQSLADHQDDPAYLQAFMGAGGLDEAARAARILHGQDGTHKDVVLSPDSQKVLAEFGQGVAAATVLARKGTIQLPPDYLKKLTQPAGGDMWSVGMLFKYGPSGDKWDATTLSEVGGAMLDWRSKQQMRPDYVPGDLRSGIVGGYVEDKNAWYKSLGLSVDYGKVGIYDAADRFPGIDANDPSLALMQRVSENADASRQILTGPNGADHAKELVSYKWQSPGSPALDDAKWPAAVITAATLDRKAHPQESAEAAANIVNAGAAAYQTDSGRKDKDQYPAPPAGMTNALAQVFAAYVPDFAYSTDGKNGDGAYVIQPQGDGVVMLHASRDTMKGFFSEIMQNHADGDNMVNAVNAQVAMTFAQGTDSQQAQAYLADLAELRGEMSVAGVAVDYDAAARTDAEHLNDIKWLNAVGGFIASVPVPEAEPGLELVATGAEYVKASIWGGLPIASAAFSTNNASTVDTNAQVTVFDDLAQMRVAAAQGLVASGRIQPPPNHPEWAGGIITFRPGTHDQQDFEGWWTGIAQDHPEIENVYKTTMGNAFDLGAGRFKSD